VKRVDGLRQSKITRVPRCCSIKDGELALSNHKRPQSRPYGDQTKCHPGGGDISAHRSSPFSWKQDGGRTGMAL